MKTARTIGCLVLLATCCGCATRRMNTIMKSWEGHHYSCLIANWGPPTRVIEDEHGGRILCYESTGTYTTPGSATTTTTARTYDSETTYSSRTTYTPPQTHFYRRSRMFWASPSGYIYKWAWEGH